MFRCVAYSVITISVLISVNLSRIHNMVSNLGSETYNVCEYNPWHNSNSKIRSQVSENGSRARDLWEVHFF